MGKVGGGGHILKSLPCFLLWSILRNSNKLRKPVRLVKLVELTSVIGPTKRRVGERPYEFFHVASI